MSEPVGNSPRTPGDVPSNAHRVRQTPRAEAVESTEVKEVKDPVNKIIEGKVTTRKIPWYKRFAHSLVADDTQSMGDWVMQEVIIPSIRNLISDTVRGSTDRLLYGTARARGPARIGERPGLRTRYDQMSDHEPRRMLSRDARARHDFNDVVLDSRTEAIEVIEALIDRVDRYQSATVADLYDLVGVTGSFADQRWGWTDLRTADVRQVRGGFLLDLPSPEPLR